MYVLPELNSVSAGEWARSSSTLGLGDPFCVISFPHPMSKKDTEFFLFFFSLFPSSPLASCMLLLQDREEKIEDAINCEQAFFAPLLTDNIKTIRCGSLVSRKKN